MSGATLNRLRKRRPVDLAVRVTGLREALEHGGGRLEPDAVTRAQGVLTRTDERLSLGLDHTVVALAGATGSGKSSLFNALAGIPVATVGARRPTTSLPTAVVWGGQDADPLLDWLDVPRRHRTARESALDGGEQDELRGLVLIDLPDHDSTAVAHRLEVNRLVRLVDLLVWVVDPQKYADEALHAQYLKQMTEYQDVMVLVLNQIDRLPAEQVQACAADLRRLLVSDGLPRVPVLALSAVTGEGVDDLRAAVVEAVSHHEVVAQRVLADIEAVAAELRRGVGDTEQNPKGLPGRELLVDALAGAAGVPAVLDAVQADYRRKARASTGWPFTRWASRFRPDPLRRLRIGTGAVSAGKGTKDELVLGRSSLPAPSKAQRAQVELASRQVATKCSQALPQRWADAVRAAAAPPGDDLADALDQAVTAVDLGYRRPVWWRVAGLLQVLLAVAVVVGALWLGLLAGMAYLQLPEPQTPDVRGIPWPTALLGGGLVLGLLVALVGGRIGSVGARRRRRRIDKAMRTSVSQVAAARVLEPVAQVLLDHQATRRALSPPD